VETAAMVKTVLHPTEKQAAQWARKGHRYFQATLTKASKTGTWLVQACVCCSCVRESVEKESESDERKRCVCVCVRGRGVTGDRNRER
jgi:hypothetical protein